MEIKKKSKREVGFLTTIAASEAFTSIKLRNNHRHLKKSSCKCHSRHPSNKNQHCFIRKRSQISNLFIVGLTLLLNKKCLEDKESLKGEKIMRVIYY